MVACPLGLRCTVNSMHSRVLSFGFVVLNADFARFFLLSRLFRCSSSFVTDNLSIDSL